MTISKKDIKLVKTMGNKTGPGLVETKYFTFAHAPDELILESGEKLGPVTLAYETYGTLNQGKSNAILILHALTGDAHAAGYHEGDKDPGWWDNMIGPGKAFDTDKYFVICSNVIGGCKGSTGPASINPQTSKPYGLDFPLITIKDMVNTQVHLVRYLGISKLLCTAGGSMGGMQVLQWAVTHPEMVRSAIPIATTAKHSPQQIAFNEVGRQAVMADPDWQNGFYYDKAAPARGLAVARMVGHITYMSDVSMAEKFGRRIKEERPDKKFSPDFEVEGYLQYRGDNFVKRFDANSYLYITKAIDRFDLTNGSGLEKVFKAAAGVKFLVMAFKSDWLYPIYQSKEIVKACKQAQIDVSYYEINSTYGHDAFLLEVEEEEHFIKNFLRKLTDE
jgi:homoserine O-acetyltransferase/O-succinyltransferase